MMRREPWSAPIARVQVAGETLRGHPFAYWRPVVPIIPLEMIDVSIYLYPSVAAAQAGERAGGSGFMVRVALDDSRWPNVCTAYAVTNSHVVSGGATVLRVNTNDGGFDVVPVPPEAWVHHSNGDDLAIAPVSISDTVHRIKAVGSESFVERKRPIWWGVGADTAMVGRFINHEGRQRNTPTVRFGHISMVPGEPVKPDGGRLPQESFLVEERSLSGYSGSPVFVYHLFPEYTVGEDDFDPKAPDKPPFVFGLVLRLLGINWGHIRDESRLREADGTATSDKTHVRLATGMATVVPAWKLHELLFEDEEVVGMRKQAEKKWLEQHSDESPAASLDAATDEENTEFERFEDLTRKLIHVSKAEVDQKRKD
jgi:hypothetical protein